MPVDLSATSAILDGFEESGGDGWYSALLYAALDETGGDVGQAASLAEAAYRQFGRPTPREGDGPTAYYRGQKRVGKGSPEGGQFAAEGGGGKSGSGRSGAAKQAAVKSANDAAKMAKLRLTTDVIVKAQESQSLADRAERSFEDIGHTALGDHLFERRGGRGQPVDIACRKPIRVKSGQKVAYCGEFKLIGNDRSTVDVTAERAGRNQEGTASHADNLGVDGVLFHVVLNLRSVKHPGDHGDDGLYLHFGPTTYLKASAEATPLSAVLESGGPIKPYTVYRLSPSIEKPEDLTSGALKTMAEEVNSALKLLDVDDYDFSTKEKGYVSGRKAVADLRKRLQSYGLTDEQIRELADQLGGRQDQPK